MIHFIIQRFYSILVFEELVDRSIFLTSGNLWASSEPGQWRSNFPREWWIRTAIFPAAQRVQKRRNPTIAVVQILIRFLPTSLSFFLFVIFPSPTLSTRGRQFCKMRRLKCKSLIIQTKVDVGQETVSQTKVQKLNSHFSRVHSTIWNAQARTRTSKNQPRRCFFLRQRSWLYEWRFVSLF